MKPLYKIKTLLLVFMSMALMAFCNVHKSVPGPGPEEAEAEAEANQSDLPEPSPESDFLGIYSDIILTNCAVPACHDGNFEPNFLSPQAFYSTTVLHPLIKNSEDNAFKFRVEPYDTAQSVLFERITNCCFNDENDRMPVLMPQLSDEEIGRIADWILAGAPDWNNKFQWKKPASEE